MMMDVAKSYGVVMIVFEIALVCEVFCQFYKSLATIGSRSLLYYVYVRTLFRKALLVCTYYDMHIFDSFAT
jgi:hypothetical protein